MKRFAILFAILAAAGCTDEGNSRRALRSYGFTNIRVGGYGWFDCSSDDTFATKFTATNQNGQRVSGVVCCGLVAKNCTVRF